MMCGLASSGGGTLAASFTNGTLMIFETGRKTRWVVTQVVLWSVVVATVGLGVNFVVSALTAPRLPKLAAWDAGDRQAWLEVPTADALVSAPSRGRPATRPAGGLWGQRQFLRTAFVVQSAPASVGDLRNNAERLDAVFPDYFEWSDPAAGLREAVLPDVAQVLREKPGLAVLPRVSNADAAGRWHGAEVSALLADEPAGGRLIEQLAARCVAMGAAGVNVDFESLRASDRDALTRWLGRLAAAFHTHGLSVTVDVPVKDPAFDYEGIGKVVDAVVVMAYDQHYASGKPGPVAGVDWFAAGVKEMLDAVPPQKMIVAMGAYGYDWDVTSEEPARSLGFTDAMVLADRTDGVVQADGKTLNSHFTYHEPDGDEHEVWFLDGVAAWDQFMVLQRAHVGGVSFWRLGLEDPAVWRFLDCDPPESFDLRQLGRVETAQSVSVQGAGEVCRVLDTSIDGTREVTFDDKRMADYAAYTKLPHYATVEQGGRSEQKRVALTFDDGPDPRWTPEVLKVLRREDVRGTFFLVGERAEVSPNLVQREFAQGHLIGNHTFTHPHLGKVPAERLRFEVDATQRVIEGVTGRQTLLFRSPFDTDTTPLTSDQIVPLQRVCDRGYYVVGADVDSRDTEVATADEMVRNVLANLERTGGNVIVFHDAGTDRSQTVEAVRRLIPILKSRGYEFVTVDQLIGAGRDAVMPPAPASDRVFVAGNHVLAWGVRYVWPGLWKLLLIASALSIVRVLGLFVLIAHSAWRRRGGRGGTDAKPFTPAVTVLIPAYNEERVIARTVRGVLASDYPADRLNVMVVDDGSTDRTADVVRGLIAEHPHVRLLAKENGGKYSALNLGFAQAEDPYVVTIDADTIVTPGTVRALVAPFADAAVDAVCGNVQVGNVRNLLTAFQDVEYVTTQNYDRRAFEALNCITVVPGATGAWRRTKILAIGGYSRDTLTEDADLTLSLLRHNGRIVYAPDARSVTEAPEDLGAWVKQRFRWRFGMLQCLWKHRRGFGRGLLGWVALPNIASQMVFELLSPVCDVLLVLAIVAGQITPVAKCYALFLTLDFFGAIVAFRLDRRRMRTLWVLPLHRVFYRPFLYWVTLRSVVAMFRGRRHGWNKLDRTATVRVEAGRPGKPLAVPAGK